MNVTVIGDSVSNQNYYVTSDGPMSGAGHILVNACVNDAGCAGPSELLHQILFMEARARLTGATVVRSHHHQRLVAHLYREANRARRRAICSTL